MAKNFTSEDKRKKHETNIKSAVSGYGLAGLLGLVYVIRYFIKGNFDFYFSLSFTELLLRLADGEKIPTALSYALMGLFGAVYIIALIFMSKDASKLKLGFGIYLFDCMCLIPLAMVMGGIQPEFFIDVTVHLFVVVFVSAGLHSFRQLQQSTTA